MTRLSSTGKELWEFLAERGARILALSFHWINGVEIDELQYPCAVLPRVHVVEVRRQQYRVHFPSAEDYLFLLISVFKFFEVTSRTCKDLN